jgi:hypothetical protein
MLSLKERNKDTFQTGTSGGRKEQKRKLKPQALRQAKARLAQFKKRHTGRPKGDLSFCGSFFFINN